MTPPLDTGTDPRPARECIEDGCTEPAGTPWGPYWCPRHDRERLDRISASLDAIAESLEPSR